MGTSATPFTRGLNLTDSVSGLLYSLKWGVVCRQLTAGSKCLAGNVQITHFTQVLFIKAEIIPETVKCNTMSRGKK